jgi:hypothetical protein
MRLGTGVENAARGVESGRRAPLTSLTQSDRRLNLFAPRFSKSHSPAVVPPDHGIFVAQLCRILQSPFRSCPSPRRGLRYPLPHRRAEAFYPVRVRSGPACDKRGCGT